MKNYYEILRAEEDSTQEEIKKSYRKLIRECHPDLNIGKDIEELNKKSSKINIAYEVLGDIEKRKEYDNEINYKDNHDYDYIYEELIRQKEREWQEYINHINRPWWKRALYWCKDNIGWGIFWAIMILYIIDIVEDLYI